MPPAKKAKTKPAPVSEGRVKAADFLFHDEKLCHPADGQCMADALATLGCFVSTNAAVLALDGKREEWATADGKAGLRGDQLTPAFLGIKGETWHIQILQRALLAKGWNFRKVRRLFAIHPSS
jgi:hypothetical protein